MRVGVVGLNHKIADLKLREETAKACQRRFGTINAVRDEGAFVLLSTCNRTEVYFFADELAATHSFLLDELRQELQGNFEHRLYSYFGLDCLVHLSRVTAGLDSALVGETEIQGQVKVAYEQACQYGTLPAPLHFMFQKSLKVGKKIRTEVKFSRTQHHLKHGVWALAERQLFAPEKSKVLLIGASEINQKVFQFLWEKGVRGATVCNRSLGRAEAFVEGTAAKVLPWIERERWHEFDWVICGTKCPQHLISQETLPQKGLRTRLLVDLSVPRNIDPQLAEVKDLQLFNIDEINAHLAVNRLRAHACVTKAEEMAQEMTRRNLEIFLAKEQSRRERIAVSA